jgi:hypothetical protein
MALGSTRPLTEMSTRNLSEGKGRPGRKTDNRTSICESSKCGSLDVSQTYGPLRPVAGIALPFTCNVLKELLEKALSESVLYDLAYLTDACYTRVVVPKCGTRSVG